jgi:DNA mismatch repair protein PMS2
MSEQVTVTTATSDTSPLGVSLDMDSHGRVKKRSNVARQVCLTFPFFPDSCEFFQTGTTVTLANLFISLPVRRKEFERNVKREFGKALALLNAYALGPCSAGSGVRLTVSNQPEKGYVPIFFTYF